MHPFVLLVFLPCDGINREKGKDFAICKLVSFACVDDFSCFRETSLEETL